jgi:L,D-transpeptidase YcbB
MNIQKSEVLPVLAQTPDLSEFRYQALSQDGDVVADAGITAAQLQDIRAGRLHIRQLPHADNPMGLLKFVFPNRADVYLHDIPNREVHFIIPQREISHGCIHLEKPAELAAWLLRDQPGWTPARIQNAMLHGPDDARVYLSRPIPVLIFYTTATVANGRVHFYPDIYGYDAELNKAISSAYPSRNQH